MANRFEDYRNDEAHGGGFVLGLLAGAVIGAGLGMLFAPKPGSELRSDLSSSANEFADAASRQYQRAASTATEYAEKGRQAYNSAVETGRQAYNTTRETVRGKAGEAQSYAHDMAEDAGERIADFGSTVASEARRS